MLVLHARMELEPDRREEARSVVADLAADSRGEPGVIDYRVGEDVEATGELHFLERYDDHDALEAHQETDHYRAFDERRDELVVGPADVTIYEIEDATTL